MILFGYDENNIYKCYNPSTNRIVYSRDVKFLSLDDIPISLQSNEDNSAEQSTLPRCSNRVNKGVPPQRYGYPFNSKYMDWYTQHTTKTDNNSQHDENQSKIQSENEKYSINSIFSIIEPSNYNQAITDENKDKWIEAMNDEMKSLHKNNTWTICKLPEDRKAIASKWIYTVKTDQNGKVNRFKARLVAQGFSQKFGIDYNHVFAPVAKHSTLRILLSIASKENFIVKHLDVKTAFLNGKLQETIYMKQPAGYEIEGKEDYVCLLQRSLYGLKQAPKSWNDEINDTLIQMNFKRNRADPCLYQKKFTNGDECILLIYVDDILIMSK